jgi:hypothetical protein
MYALISKVQKAWALHNKNDKLLKTGGKCFPQKERTNGKSRELYGLAREIKSP